MPGGTDTISHQSPIINHLTRGLVGAGCPTGPQACLDRPAQLPAQSHHALHRCQILLVQIVEVQPPHRVTASRELPPNKCRYEERESGDGGGDSQPLSPSEKRKQENMQSIVRKQDRPPRNTLEYNTLHAGRAKTRACSRERERERAESPRPDQTRSQHWQQPHNIDNNQCHFVHNDTTMCLIAHTDKTPTFRNNESHNTHSHSCNPHLFRLVLKLQKQVHKARRSPLIPGSRSAVNTNPYPARAAAPADPTKFRLRHPKPAPPLPPPPSAPPAP